MFRNEVKLPTWQSAVSTEPLYKPLQIIYQEFGLIVYLSETGHSLCPLYLSPICSTQSIQYRLERAQYPFVLPHWSCRSKLIWTDEIFQPIPKRKIIQTGRDRNRNTNQIETLLIIYDIYQQGC